jgi:hypothetical protein
VPAEEGQPGLSQPLDDPVAYGKAAYQALFPTGTPAGRSLEAMPERILLVTTDETIDAIPWEYAYSPDGFLVAEYPFVRGLPSDKRIAPPTLDSGLHIVAIPSDPLDKELNPLNIDGEWTRLQEIIRKVSHAVTLERAYPPTIEQVRRAWWQTSAIVWCISWVTAGRMNRWAHFSASRRSMAHSTP